jgi:ribose transport system substrate-binding protein
MIWPGAELLARAIICGILIKSQTPLALANRGLPSRSMKLLRLIHFVSAFALLVTQPACRQSSKTADSATTKVAFVSNNMDPFWNICEKGAQKAAAEFNVDLLYQRPEKATMGEQKQIIDGFMVQHAAGISVSVIDPKSQRDYLEEIGSKTNLICVDNDLELKEGEKTNRLFYLGTDNIAAGRGVGELVEKALPEGGTVVFFVGQLEAVNARERWKGVVLHLDEVEKKKPGVKYKHYGNGPDHLPFTDNAILAKCKENAENVLIALKDEPKICMIGLWAVNPPGIYSAVLSRGLEGKVKIAAFDENEITLKGIRAGHIEGTVVQDPYNFGYQSVKLMAQIAKGDRSGIPASGKSIVPHRIITRENLDAFKEDLDKKMGTK